MRIFIRTSRWAIWARRFASFALPLALFSTILHRTRTLSSETFTILIGLVFVFAFAAIVTSCISFVRLWNTGDKGWGRAFQALGMGLAFIIPMIWASWMMSRYPVVNDVTTGQIGMPALAFAKNPHRVAFSGQKVLEHWSHAAPRTYPLDVTLLFDMVEKLVLEQGWEIWRKRDPEAGLADGEIHAIATSWLGWRDEIAIVIEGDDNSARINIRSASFWALHDLGTNGRRIETFLRALDAKMSDAQRDGLTTTPTPVNRGG